MIMIMIMIIITLFESQIILAEHECCTNWGDCKSNKSNQLKCWFLTRGENRSSRRKTSQSRVENQQTQPTYDAGAGTWSFAVFSWEKICLNYPVKSRGTGGGGGGCFNVRL